MVKGKVSKFEVTTLGFDNMGVWIGGLIANEGKSKVKCKLNLKCKLNQNQKKSKCINYVILDSVFV